MRTVSINEMWYRFNALINVSDIERAGDKID